MKEIINHRPRLAIIDDSWTIARLLSLFVSLLVPLTGWSGGGSGPNLRFAPSIVVADNERCSICLEQAQDPVGVCAAAHVMCRDRCLEPWLEQRDSCPLCRRTLLLRFLPVIRAQQLPVFFPTARDNGDYLELPYWWQVTYGKNLFDQELYQAFALLFTGQDQFPTWEQVNELFSWDIWQQDEDDIKVLDRELLIVLFKIFYGQGLPTRELVDGILQEDFWWQGKGENRTLDRPLLARLCAKPGHSLTLASARTAWVVDNQPTMTESACKDLKSLCGRMCNMRADTGLPSRQQVASWLSRDNWW